MKNKKRINKFDIGGDLTGSAARVSNPYMTEVPISANTNIAIDPNLVSSSASSGISPMGIAGAASAGINFIGTAINNANPTIPKVDTPSVVSNANTNDSVMADWNNWSPIKHISKKDLGSKGAFGDTLGGTLGGAAAGAAAGSVVPGIGTAIGAGVGGLIGGITSLFGSNKKKRAVRRINRQIDAANKQSESNLYARAEAVDTMNDWNSMANFAAFGGQLNNIPLVFSNPFGSGAIAYEAMNNMITPIKDEKTSFRIPNTLEDGGLINTIENAQFTDGGIFSNGVTFFDEGGTHEENPLGGIMQGMGENGLPNLVEEGEVKYDDYIYSNRIKSNEDLLELVNLPSKYKNKTIADIAKNISKESEERPFDPISQRGLKDGLGKLRVIQELQKAGEDVNNEELSFAKGGPLSKRIANYGKTGVISEQPILLDTNQEYSFDINNPIGVVNKEQPVVVDANNTETPPTNPPKDEVKKKKGFTEDMLRYAPVVGSSIGLMNDIFGSGFTPDYSGVDTVANSSISPSTINNYLRYNPLDRNYYQNMLNSQAGATRSSILNNSGGNRAVANAALLAADSNYLNSIGNLARQAEEYNLAQRERVENFNRGTNMFNSEADLKAQMFNTENRNKAALLRSEMKNNAQLQKQQSLSANLTNFFDNIGDIGREAYTRNMIESNPGLLYSIDRSGNISYRVPEKKSETKKEDNKKDTQKKSRGGKLNKNKNNYGI